MIEINPAAFGVNRSGDFSPRTSPEERMAIIALFRAGIRVAVLAEAFGMNRRTVLKLVNPKNKKDYVTLKHEIAEIPQEELYEKYVTDAIKERINEVVRKEAE